MLGGHRINGAAMAGRTVDEVPLGVWFEVLHFHELVVDEMMHGCHLSGCTLRPLLIAGEILFDMAVGAGDSQCTAVSDVHDHQKPGSRSGLHDLDVF